VGLILVIDDEQSIREMLEMLLRNSGHEVRLAAGGPQGLALALEQDFDLIISDIRMPDLNGLEILKRYKEQGRNTAWILMSAYASDETAVSAMHLGAFDLIPKPFENQDFLSAVNAALTHRSADQERQALAENIKTQKKFGSLYGTAQSMFQVYELITRAAQTNTSILITGESGTGKELVARAVHQNSARHEKKFLAINCGGIPEQLMESELFGYKKGSFTGAQTDKTGLVFEADGGTLFLDELAELTLPMQVKLLRLAQEKTYRPVGGHAEKTADVRFIAATNKNLETEIAAGRFREDLYYRLNVINIRLPPLRERPEDIPLLAQFFLDKYSKIQGKDVRKLSTYALAVLTKYHFPGNVRELENIIERSVALEQSNIILPESLRLADFTRPGPDQTSAQEPLDFLGSFTDSPLPAAPLNQPSGPAWPPVPAEEYFPLPAVGADKAQARAFLRLRAEENIDHVLENLTSYYIFYALKQTDGKVSRASHLLNMSAWRMRIHMAGHKLPGGADLSSRDQSDFPKPVLARNLPPDWAPDWTGKQVDLVQILHQVELYYQYQAMKMSKDNKTQASEFLGLTLRAFKHRTQRTDYEHEKAKLDIMEGRSK
jgi:two-component system response regulator PilR (NtrC family)